MRCDVARLSLGAYVLAGLDADDRDGVEAHLRNCASCTTELAELAALPGLLGLLSVDEVEAGAPAPSPDAYDRLLARAEAQAVVRPRPSRWTRGRVAVAAAAAAVVVAGAVVVGLTSGRTTPGAHTYSASSGRVQMSVTLTDQVRGTGLDVSVRGVTGNARCSLVAVARDGTRHTVSSWQTTYSGQAWSKAAMPLPQSQLSQLVLVGDDGRTLVSLRL